WSSDVCSSDLPIANPFLSFTFFKNTTRLSKLSNGSPIPITTIWLTRSSFSRLSKNICTCIICSTISPADRSRFLRKIPLAQNEQPILQPTRVVTQTDNPQWSSISTVSINCLSCSLNKNLIVPSLDSCFNSTSSENIVKFSSNNAMQL